jgi:hypothetical protein
MNLYFVLLSFFSSPIASQKNSKLHEGENLMMLLHFLSLANFRIRFLQLAVASKDLVTDGFMFARLPCWLKKDHVWWLNLLHGLTGYVQTKLNRKGCTRPWGHASTKIDKAVRASQLPLSLWSCSTS